MLRYCGPFEILAKIGLVAYQLALQPTIKVHNVFHVSILKKCVHDATHVIDWNLIYVEPKGEFQLKTKRILDKREILLQNCTIRQVKVEWKHFTPYESTWELESNMREAYPILFQYEIMEE